VEERLLRDLRVEVELVLLRLRPELHRVGVQRRPVGVDRAPDDRRVLVHDDADGVGARTAKGRHDSDAVHEVEGDGGRWIALPAARLLVEGGEAVTPVRQSPLQHAPVLGVAVDVADALDEARGWLRVEDEVVVEEAAVERRGTQVGEGVEGGDAVEGGVRVGHVFEAVRQLRVEVEEQLQDARARLEPSARQAVLAERLADRTRIW